MSKYRDARLQASTIRSYMTEVPNNEVGISGTHAVQAKKTKEKKLTKCEVISCAYLFVKKGMKKFCPTHADMSRRGKSL